MAEVIQFNCPACGALLRVPLTMAAHEGPCPTCKREIIAPDPVSGVAAHTSPMGYFPALVERIQPFGDSPPLVPLMDTSNSPAPPVSLAEKGLPDAMETQLAKTTVLESLGKSKKRSRNAMFLPCLFTLAVGLTAGFAVGVRSTRDRENVSAIAPVRPPVETSDELLPAAIQAPTTAPEPVTEPITAAGKPMIDAPLPDNQKEPAKISAAAEASLRAFLDAPDWAARSAHVLSAETVKAAMEAYSREVPDGPTFYQSISVKQSHFDEVSGNTLFIFLVTTHDFPGGIPVAVAETAKGWLVDWQAFVEFRDDQFKKFADGSTDRTGRFQLIVSAPPPARAANTENEHFVSFLLEPPFPKRQKLAFVKRNSEAFTICQAATANGQIFTPVLEVAKRTTPDGKGYLEIIKVLASDWRPRP